MAKVLGFELNSADNMGVADLVDFLLEGGKLLELVFVVLQRRVLFGELLDGFLDVVHPEPLKTFEACQQLVDLVLSALDRTC